MQLKKFLIQTLLIVATMVCILSSLFILYLILQNRIDNSPKSFIENTASFFVDEKINFSLPTRFKIPKINVDATIQYVGLTKDGAMDAPTNPLDVAWFNLGPFPGEVGSSVIAGHSGYSNNKKAVFDNLNKLQKGDKIYVEDKKGIVHTFVVREFRDYDPESDATDVFFSDDGKAHLNLITCEGIWNEITKSRSQRLVVFTDKE